jgi:uncharacterized RDD family membrane protein YckC
MKCPKCLYLGFETGDRCKNCGYDFSLLTLADESDVMLQTPADRSDAGRSAPVPGAWEEPDLDLRSDGDLAGAPPVMAEIAVAGAGSGGPATVRARTAGDRAERGLPLFPPQSGTDEGPLISVPASPRPPLAVRRASESPRFKPPLPTLTRPDDEEPDLGFSERRAATRPIVVSPARERGREQTLRREVCKAGPRAMAALLDIAILLAIDLAVVYFTLRMAVLTMDDWRLLPAIPMLVFLTLLKVAYYAAFTAIGGQTIGKMAAHIRVVTEEDTFIGPARALQRTLAAAASFVTLGAAFAPALVGGTGRALHDRVAHTRVVAVPPA